MSFRIALWKGWNFNDFYNVDSRKKSALKILSIFVAQVGSNKVFKFIKSEIPWKFKWITSRLINAGDKRSLFFVSGKIQKRKKNCVGFENCNEILMNAKT